MACLVWEETCYFIYVSQQFVALNVFLNKWPCPLRPWFGCMLKHPYYVYWYSVWEISGRQVAIATKVSHQATSFFVAGAKWATLSVIARSIDRSRESARRKGAGFHDSAPRACVSLSVSR